MFSRFSVYFKQYLKGLAYCIGAAILMLAVVKCALEEFPFVK